MLLQILNIHICNCKQAATSSAMLRTFLLGGSCYIKQQWQTQLQRNKTMYQIHNNNTLTIYLICFTKLFKYLLRPITNDLETMKWSLVLNKFKFQGTINTYIISY